jgi:superoxide dismutase, Cu-Zn family
MRFASLLVAMACACATSSSSTTPSGGAASSGADGGTAMADGGAMMGMDAGMMGGMDGGMMGGMDGGMMGMDGGMMGMDGGFMATDAGMDGGSAAAPSGPVPSVATAKLEARSGSKITGNARVTPTASGVAVMVEVQNATPGPHGVHIHEKGDCSDPAAASAGGHFNPKTAAHHGGSGSAVRHGGDLGNMNVDSNGRGLLIIAVGDMTMSNVVGKAVVVHEKQDDLQSDPAGNSGARIACGVLQAKASQ